MKCFKQLKWAKILYSRDCGIRKIGRVWLVKCGRHIRRKFYIYYLNGEKTSPIHYSRFKMEVKLKRRLNNKEDVHHKDGNTLNDEYGNLEVISHGKHTSITHKGKCVNKEIRRKLSAAKSGKNNPNYDKHHSEETRRKISLACKKACKEAWKRRKQSSNKSIACSA